MTKQATLDLLHAIGLRRSHISNLPLRVLVRPLARRKAVPLELLMGAPLDTTFRVDFPGASFAYHVGPNDGLGARLFWQKWEDWEPYVIPQFARFALHARRVLDVGAHTGIYSLFACALNPSVETLSFEPLPLGYEAIHANLQLNQFTERCRVFHSAVSDHNGRARFHIAEDTTMSSLTDSEGELEVSVITLDSVVPLDGNTDLVKIDVEGHEYKALMGMREVMSDSKPTVLFECNPGSPGPQIDQLLRGMGYRLFSMVGGSLAEIFQLIPEQFPNGNHNFLAVHSDRAAA